MNKSRMFRSHESEAQVMRRITMWSVLSLIVGVGVGMLVALLYAPTSGKRMRRNLTWRMEDGLDSGQEVIEPVVKKLEKEVGGLRHTLEERIAKLM